MKDVTGRCWLSLALLFPLAACAERDVVWRVGDAGYTEEEVGPLEGERRESLADFTAFGHAVANGATGEILAPVVRATRRERLSRSLGYALVAEELEYETLRPWYERNPRWELTVRHVIRMVEEDAPEEEVREARRAAEAVRARAVRGDDFAELAAEHSEEPGAAERGGRLEPGRRGSWVEPFWDAAVALEPGEVSEVIRTRYGFHVILLEDREPLPFEEVPRIEVLRSAIPAAQAQHALRQWAEAAETRLSIDEAAARRALGRWREGRPPQDDEVARWTGGAFADRELMAHLALLEPGQARRFREARAEASMGRIRDFARTAMYADATAARGIALSPAEQAELRRDWEGRISRWSAMLGVREGADIQDVREQALEAVRTDLQDVRILREELRTLRPFLREHHPVSDASSGSSSSESVTTERNL